MSGESRSVCRAVRTDTCKLWPGESRHGYLLSGGLFLFTAGEKSMRVETTIDVVDQKRWYRVGGLAALVLGICYVAIIPLYAHVGVPPNGGGEAWFKYLSGKTTFWWTILGLSVFTDFLFVPVALALYLALKGVNRNAMLLATAFVGLFVVLDLAITWSHYASILTLYRESRIMPQFCLSTVSTPKPRMTLTGQVTLQQP